MNNNRNVVVSKSSYRTYSSTTIIVIIGILGLALVSVYLYNMYKEFKQKVLDEAKNKAQSAVCPDYWETVGEKRCKNINKLGTCNITPGAEVYDFDNEVFNNKNTGEYAKCRWAKDCNIAWGGIDRLC